MINSLFLHDLLHTDYRCSTLSLSNYIAHFTRPLITLAITSLPIAGTITGWHSSCNKFCVQIVRTNKLKLTNGIKHALH